MNPRKTVIILSPSSPTIETLQRIYKGKYIRILFNIRLNNTINNTSIILLLTITVQQTVEIVSLQNGKNGNVQAPRI